MIISVRRSGGSRHIDLLIFDLDGTLVDTRADLTAAVNHTLEKLALPPLSMEQVCRYVGDGLETLLSRALGLQHGDLVDNAVRLFRDYYGLHLLDRTRLYPGVRETLEHFRGKRKAIVTNKPLAFSERILAGLEIESHFEVILGGDSTVQRKPHPEPALKVTDVGCWVLVFRSWVFDLGLWTARLSSPKSPDVGRWLCGSGSSPDALAVRIGKNPRERSGPASPPTA